MAKKAKGFGENTFRAKKKIRRRGRHSKSPNKAAKVSLKISVGQGKPI